MTDMSSSQIKKTNSSQDVWIEKHDNSSVKRVTIDEARKYIDNIQDIAPQRCEFCGKELKPVGLLFHVLGKWWWIYNHEYEACDCEEAKRIRELKRIEEEKRLQEEKERAYREKIEKMIIESKLGERFRTRTFENFIVNDKNRYAYETAKKYSTEFEKHKKDGLGLIFVGSYGTGKTHLAAAICHELIKQNYQPIFGTMITLLEKIKATYDDEYAKENEEQVIDKYTRCDLLVIDDLGKERPTEWAIEKLYYIINTRYERNLPIVITTNYSIDKLINRLTVKDNVETAEAIVSRLYEMCVGIQMEWEDFRKL